MQITCKPIPGHEQNCPQELSVDMPQGTAPAKTLKAARVTGPLRAARGAPAPSTNGTISGVKYTLRLPSKRT